MLSVAFWGGGRRTLLLFFYHMGVCLLASLRSSLEVQSDPVLAKDIAPAVVPFGLFLPLAFSWPAAGFMYLGKVTEWVSLGSLTDLIVHEAECNWSITCCGLFNLTHLPPLLMFCKVFTHCVLPN